MNDFTIEKKIKIIRDFVSVAQPKFNGNEHAMPYIIWNLYNRVCDAVKSFILLIDNQRYYDAFIIAGNALEACAVLSYIKDNEKEDAQLENYNKYISLSSLNRLIANLEMAENLEKDIACAYASVLQIFYPQGHIIIKNSKNPKDKHEEVIKKIKFRSGENIEKIKLLKKYYKSPAIQSFIKAFSDNIKNSDDGQFNLWYTKYCNYKHGNMMAPGALAGDICQEEVTWFIDLIHILVWYLDYSKLAPFKPCDT